MLNNILTHESARITCVDTWQRGIEHQNMERPILLLCQACFDVNVFLTGNPEKVIKKVGLSSEIMRLLPMNSYDLIYVDGSHEAEDVLVDAVRAWGILKVGGRVIFEDYGLGGGVKEVVDVFLNFFANKLNLIHISLQVFCEKTAYLKRKKLINFLKVACKKASINYCNTLPLTICFLTLYIHSADLTYEHGNGDDSIQ